MLFGNGRVAGLNDDPKIYKPHKNYEEGYKAIVHSAMRALDQMVYAREFTFVVPLLRENIWINFTDTFYSVLLQTRLSVLIVSYCSNNVPSHI